MNKRKEKYIIPEAEIWEFEQVSMSTTTGSLNGDDDQSTPNVTTGGVVEAWRDDLP